MKASNCHAGEPQPLLECFQVVTGVCDDHQSSPPPKVPEFELAAHLAVFNLQQLVVARRHAAVLHEPLGTDRWSLRNHKEKKTENQTESRGFKRTAMLVQLDMSLL